MLENLKKKSFVEFSNRKWTKFRFFFLIYFFTFVDGISKITQGSSSLMAISEAVSLAEDIECLRDK